MESVGPMLPVVLYVVCAAGLAVMLLVLGYLFNPKRVTPVKQMPYESGMDPIHDTRRRFDVRFHLLAIAFLVFDVELLFLYPWAVTAAPTRAAVTATTMSQSDPPEVHQVAAPATAESLTQSAAGRSLVANRGLVFTGVMVFVALLALGFIYDWRKGIFEWR